MICCDRHIAGPPIRIDKITMSSWAIPGIKPSCTAGLNTGSFYSAPKERRIRYTFRLRVGSGLGRRSSKHETRVLLRHCFEAPGPRPSPCPAREGSKRILKSDGHVLVNSRKFNPLQTSLDDGEKQERTNLESSKALNEELRSSNSRFAPFCSDLGMPSTGRSFMNRTFAGGYEREVIHKEVVRRLNSVGAADNSEGIYGQSRTESDSVRSRSFCHSPDDINFVEKGRYDQLGRERVSNEESITANSLATGDVRVPVELEEHDDQGRWARRSLLNHCIPVILEKLGFNFPIKNLATNQGLNNLHNVNVTVCYQMRYELASEGSQFLYRSETGKDFLSHDGNLRVLTSDSMRQVSRPLNLASSKSNTEGGAQISGARKVVNLLEDGRNPSFRSKRYSDSQMLVPNARRPGVRWGGRKPGGLWLQADGDIDENPPQSTLWRDMFTIIGLGAFIICGTYAFAVSNRYMKFGSRNKCTSTTTRSRGSDSHLISCLKQHAVVELTNCNFETSVSKKPTFVLFYAPWCSHCQQLEHTWKDLASRLPKSGFDVQLAQVDAEKYCQVAERYKVVKYPTLIFFKEGRPMENHTGPRDVDSLITFIDENYNL